MNSIIELLKKLITINSINPFEINKNKDGQWSVEGNEQTITEFILDILLKYGYKCQKQFVHQDSKGHRHYNILAEKGNEESPAILFYGHLDTVTANPWNSLEEALNPVVKKRLVNGKLKDTLVGLGANDMKAGLSVIIEAFKDFTPKNHKIKLAFGVDEEFYSLGGNKLASSNFMKDVKAVVVPEIGDGPNTFSGISTIGLGRLGRAEFIIEVYGSGGHGAISYRKEFINAAVEVAKIVQRLEKIRINYQDNFKFYEGKVKDENATNIVSGSFYVNRIEGGDGSLSIPSIGKIIIDYTFIPNKNLNYMEKLLNDLIDDMYDKNELQKVFVGGKFKKIKIYKRDRPTKYSEAYLTDENHPFTLFVKDEIEKISDFYNYNMGYSVADENVIKRENPHIPVLVSGPIGFNSHKEDEWVDIDSVNDLLRLYRNLGMNFDKYLTNNQSS